jgi:hypothetical protein
MGLTSYSYTYVTPHFFPHVAVLGLLDLEDKSSTILQNSGNHLPSDTTSCSKKLESLHLLSVVHNMIVCCDWVLIRNRHKVFI